MRVRGQSVLGGCDKFGSRWHLPGRKAGIPGMAIPIYREEEFKAYVGQIREANRRRPNFMKMLGRARWG
ncbi:MAG: hypothetical protein HY608_01695 [Planctomycetes bacterium]|nr:hypothetical protein [Planctomycetota bacterium]